MRLFSWCVFVGLALVFPLSASTSKASVQQSPMLKSDHHATELTFTFQTTDLGPSTEWVGWVNDMKHSTGMMHSPNGSSNFVRFFNPEPHTEYEVHMRVIKGGPSHLGKCVVVPPHGTATIFEPQNPIAKPSQITFVYLYSPEH